MFEEGLAVRAGSAGAAARHDVGAVLARWTVEDPGPAAVAELSGIDPTRLGEADRVRLVVALDRQAAWIASLQLPALVAVGDAYTETVAEAREVATERLTAADATDPAAAYAERGGRSVTETVSSIFGDDPDRWATMELAAALRVAEYTAGQRLALARVLPTRLPHLDAALRAGVVSYGHVLLVVRATEPLTDELARQVDTKLAPRYGRATPGGLRNRARHAVIAADPEGAARRHEAAARRRQVSSRPEPDGMATLSVYGAAPDSSLLEAAICDIAERTAAAAQRAGRLIPDQDALHADARQPDSARTYQRETDQPRPADTGPEAGAPDARAPDAYEPDEDPDGGRAERGGAEAGPPVRWGKRGRRRRGRDHTVVNIVIDLPTLLGLAENPTRLDGYGSIPAGLARRLAADAAWRRMITDPITRRLLDRAPGTYRPGDQLAAYVRARDLVCDHPGCTRAAEGCQLDHDNPFDPTDPHGGRTTADEIYPRCEPHHNGKTHLGWATGTRPDGTRYTRSPHGFDYDLEPNPYLDTG